MSTYYQATTVIGYRITTKNCFEETQQPNCEHNPPAQAKFCPTCGVPVGTRPVRYMKDQYSNFIHEFVNDLPDDFVFDQLYDGHGDQFWLGYGSTSDAVERVEPKSYEDIKTEIAELLEPFTQTGLFVLNEGEFGIWTIHAGH